MPPLKPLIRSLVPDQLAELVQKAGQPPYRAQQLGRWLYRDEVHTWQQMTNLPASWLEQLAAEFDLVSLAVAERQVSQDGTRKFLFHLRDGQSIESVIIPMAEHVTFCLSTQVGCAMAGRFCATALGGLVRQLEAAEILDQIFRLQEDLKLHPYDGLGSPRFNIVFMGMGEPLDNWTNLSRSLDIMQSSAGLDLSKRRIQISTSGPQEGLEHLIEKAPGVGLTLSLGGVTDQQRKTNMPGPGRTPVATALELALRYCRQGSRRLTVAWVLIPGSTDSLEDATKLADLLEAKPCKVNLIPWNRVADDNREPPTMERVLDFQKILRQAGIDCFVRSSGGQDIAAACGQLRRQRLRSPTGD